MFLQYLFNGTCWDPQIFNVIVPKFSSHRLLGHSSFKIYWCSHVLCVFLILVIFRKIYTIEVVLVLCIKTQSENSDESAHVIERINLKSCEMVYISYCAYEFLTCSHFLSDLFLIFKKISMSQSSSSSEPRLEIAEHQTKGATTMNVNRRVAAHDDRSASLRLGSRSAWPSSR